MTITRAERKQLYELVQAGRPRWTAGIGMLFKLMKRATTADKLKMAEGLLAGLAEIIQVYRFILGSVPVDSLNGLDLLEAGVLEPHDFSVAIGLPVKKATTKKRGKSK